MLRLFTSANEQSLRPNQVDARHRQQQLESDSGNTAQLSFSYRDNGLCPAEQFVDAFSTDPADALAFMPGR